MDSQETREAGDMLQRYTENEYEPESQLTATPLQDENDEQDIAMELPMSHTVICMDNKNTIGWAVAVPLETPWYSDILEDDNCLNTSKKEEGKDNSDETNATNPCEDYNN